MRGPVLPVGPHEELEGEVVDMSSCDDLIGNGVIVFKDFFLLMGIIFEWFNNIDCDCEHYLALKI